MGSQEKEATTSTGLPHSRSTLRLLWDSGACAARCALLWTITLPAPLYAEARPLTHSAHSYRAARAPDSTRIERLLQEAADHARDGQRALPGGFRLMCERTLALPLPVDNPAVQEGRRRALTLLARQALARRARIDAALQELERAERLDPRDAEVTRTRARMLALWEEPASIEQCEVHGRAADAADALRALHREHPELRSSDTWFELGGLLARTGAHADAAAAYRQAIALAFDPSERSAAYARLAEATMLDGDAHAALAHYERALANIEAGPDAALVRFGLAVALDRAGEQDAALEQAVLALEQAERSLDVLGPDSVLFEPPFERAIYEGLAHEALAQVRPETRVASLQTAAQRYSTFLSQVDRDHVYRNAAEADLRRVLAQLREHGAVPASATGERSH